MHIVFYISGHGFGHASRDVELINAIAAAGPDVADRGADDRPGLAVRARERRRRRSAGRDRHRTRPDRQPPIRRARIRSPGGGLLPHVRRARRRGSARARGTLGADLVVGDIPPLAFAAADRAGVQSMAIGNFTWDWIYGVYPAFEALAPDVIPTIRAAYATATRALRLPFHGGFEPMAAVTDDIPLIARRSRRDPADTRRLLGVADDRPLVLASFGAYGAPLPYDAIRAERRSSRC